MNSDQNRTMSSDRRTFDLFLFLNGSLGPFLIGVAVATFFTGAMFSLNAMNQVQWATPWYGLEALLNLRNLALGCCGFISCKDKWSAIFNKYY